MVLEVLTAARKRLSVKDFQVQCRLSPVENGKSFFDRIRVAENLIRDKLIEVDDGYLRLGAQNIPPSLINDLKDGSELAWEILDCLEPTSNTLKKIDLELLSRIGLEGELAVVRDLKNNLPDSEWPKVKHISLIDDSAGFDIHAPSVRNPEAILLLEVKTSPRPGPNFSFYISRNEVRVAQQNLNWVLLGVSSTPSGYRVLGSLDLFQFIDYLPLNQHPQGHWESAKITVPTSLFKNGLP